MKDTLHMRILYQNTQFPHNYYLYTIFYPIVRLVFLRRIWWGWGKVESGKLFSPSWSMKHNMKCIRGVIRGTQAVCILWEGSPRPMPGDCLWSRVVKWAVTVTLQVGSGDNAVGFLEVQHDVGWEDVVQAPTSSGYKILLLRRFFLQHLCGNGNQT